MKCGDCKFRYTEECLMRFDDSDYGIIDNTEDNSFCSDYEVKDIEIAKVEENTEILKDLK